MKDSSRAAMPRTSATALASELNWFGHPPGLTILFLTEAWEKFSYFGMRTILVFYMTKQLLFVQADASMIYGFYTGFATLTPLAGGWIADRYLGRRRAVLTGGLVMAVGHFMMAFDFLLFPALATIAIGNGFYLPNLASQVAPLYPRDDPRAKGAITVYYTGKNVGAFLAPFVVGTLGEVYGWHYGFAAAGCGMLLGLMIFIAGSRYLPQTSRAGRNTERTANGRSAWRHAPLMAWILLLLVIVRAPFNQIGNTVPLWIDGGVDRHVANLTIPMTWFQALNPLFVFALTPLLVLFWGRRALRTGQDGTAGKLAMGALFVAAGYALLALSSWYAERAGLRASWVLAVIYYFLITAGELYLMPISLTLFTRLAPAAFAATAVAIWYVNSFLGSFVGGYVGGYWSRLDHASFFGLLAVLSAGPAIAFRLLDGAIRRAEADPASGSQS